MYISHDVVFDEMIFPFAQHSNTEALEPKTSHQPTVLPTPVKNTLYREHELNNSRNSQIDPALNVSHISNDLSDPVVNTDAPSSSVSPAGLSGSSVNSSGNS